jgi:hypothetical protein
LITLTEETKPYNVSNNTGGWGTPNINTSAITLAYVSFYPIDTPPSTITASGTGSISGNVFTDATHLSGTFQIGQTLVGLGIAPGTTIVALLTGTGSNSGGTYQVNISQTVASTPISGISVVASYYLKNSTVDVYATAPGAPTPYIYDALVEQTWSNPDGIYQVVYTVVNGATISKNKTHHELFLCNLCNCKEALIVKLVKACDTIEIEKLKTQVDQMEVFIYGIQSAFSCGNFTTATTLLEAATKYCSIVSECGCGCSGNC